MQVLRGEALVKSFGKKKQEFRIIRHFRGRSGQRAVGKPRHRVTLRRAALRPLGRFNVRGWNSRDFRQMGTATCSGRRVRESRKAKIERRKPRAEVRDAKVEGREAKIESGGPKTGGRRRVPVKFEPAVGAKRILARPQGAHGAAWLRAVRARLTIRSGGAKLSKRENLGPATRRPSGANSHGNRSPSGRE